MVGRESSGAAHFDQGIGGTDAKSAERAQSRIVRARKANEGNIEVGGGSPQPHLNARNLGDGDTTCAAPAFGPVAENLIRAQCRT